MPLNPFTLFKKTFGYDAWLIWHVPGKCNLACGYCQTLKTESAEEINIPSLTKTLKDAGKIFRITFSGGGEPFLVPNLIDACAEITKQHYVGFNTSLISSNIEEFTKRIDPQRVFNISASLHIKELERLNLTERFIDNFLLCKEKGFSICSTIVAHPSMAKDINKYKEFFDRRGVETRFNLFIGSYKGREYPQAYSKEELGQFGLNSRSVSRDLQQYRKICNAGYNVGIIREDCTIYPCWRINDCLGHIYKKIEFRNRLMRCPHKFCFCPLNTYDRYLLKKAVLKEALPMLMRSAFKSYTSILKG